MSPRSLSLALAFLLLAGTTVARAQNAPDHPDSNQAPDQNSNASAPQQASPSASAAAAAKPKPKHSSKSVNGALNLASDGTIYFACGYYCVCAAHGEGSPLARSPWPKTYHDSSNSNRILTNY